MQLVVLVGFDETLKQFDAGSQFSPAPCVRRALGFVKDSHVRHTRDNVYAIADGRFDGVKLMVLEADRTYLALHRLPKSSNG